MYLGSLLGYTLQDSVMMIEYIVHKIVIMEIIHVNYALETGVGICTVHHP
jgi:hypothetical protein